MPVNRKPKTDASDSAPPEETPKPKRVRAKKAAPDLEATATSPSTVPVVEGPADEESATVKAPARRSRSRKAAPAPEVEAAPVVESAPAPEPEAPATEPTRRPARTRKKPTPATAQEVPASTEPESAPVAPTSAGPVTEVSAESGTTSADFFDAEERLVVTFRPRASTSAAPVRATAAEPEPAVVEAPAPSAEIPIASSTGEDLPILMWRKKGTGHPAEESEATESQDQETEEAEDSGEAGRRRRRRRRGGRPETAVTGAEPHADVQESPSETEISEPSTATVSMEAPPTATVSMEAPRISIRERTPEPPKVAPNPVKRLVPTPPDAPQVITRGGVPTIVRNHRAIPPLMFFGSPADERRAENVLEELRMAAEADVHLHSFLVDFEVDPDQIDATAGFAAYLLARAVEIDPQAQVVFRLVFQAPRNWEARYPKGVYRDAHGVVAEPSVCDDEFWSVAERCLDRFVRSLRLVEQKDHILGVHLERGEWFFSADVGYDTSTAAKHKFRDWARQRYSNDEVTLRASWFDGGARFDNIQVPEFRPEGGDGDRFIRSSRRQRSTVDYHLFLSDVTVGRIGDLAYAVKEASEGYFLVGCSYGYTFEWSHPGSGHLALGKLLRTYEIDFIAGPPSYRNREPGGSAPFPGPIDSFALNGKLYLSEEDFKTSLSTGHEPDDFNPPLKTPQALESVHWRGAGVALAHGSGEAWMDLWGNGWLKTHSVWERATRVRGALVDRLEAPLADPDVAVFIDERALAYLVDSNAFQLLVQNVRESVLRAGVSAAFYLLSDLQHREKFPESKLYLFVNAWDIRPDLRAAIKARLQRDGKVLFWLYAAGLFDAGRDSLERAREVTGIALKPQPFYSKAGTTILNRRHALSEAFPDRSLIGGTKLEPSYFAIPEDAVVLGEYTQTGLPSFVVKEFKEDPNARWTSVFLGEPLVNPALIRALAQMAGAHVWNFQEDVVHVRAPFCTVHCSGTGSRTITLPDKFSAYDLLAGDWAAIDSTNLRFHAMDGSTHVFLVGPKADIEHMLRTKPEDALRIEEIPPREANVRQDASNFDVPIMKLDEWMEGGDSDEVADEWFLRAPQLVEEETAPEQAQAQESPDSVGRRRRRRRRGRGGNGDPEGAEEAGEETITARASTGGDGGEFTMNVVFRKRD